VRSLASGSSGNYRKLVKRGMLLASKILRKIPCFQEYSITRNLPACLIIYKAGRFLIFLKPLRIHPRQIYSSSGCALWA
jgi:hypothetical protein